MRAALKGAAETLLARGGPAAVWRSVGRGGALVLAYHNVIPDDAPPPGDRSLHLRRGLFGAHLDEVTLHADVVPLETVLSRSPPGRGRHVALTFDDAYRGAVTVGVEELARRGLAATFFVAPAFVGGDGFWWDAVAAPGRGLDPKIREHGLARFGGRDREVRRWAGETGLAVTTPPPFARVASEDELRTALVHHGLHLASHSWSHPDLSQLGRDELAVELTRSRDWLAERFGAAFRPWLSFPYGLFSARVVEEAMRNEYQATLRIDGGWFRERPALHQPLPRMNVPANLSRNGLALRIAGFFCR